jgi:hypothetical protein
MQRFVAHRDIGWYGIDARGLSDASRARVTKWTLGGRGSAAYGLYMTRNARQWAALCRQVRGLVRVDVLHNHKWTEHYITPKRRGQT